MTNLVAPLSESYQERGYTPLPSLIGEELTAHLASYGQMLRDAGRFEIDHQVSGSLRRYGAAGFDTLLLSTTSAVSAAAGRSLHPTYSFARFYLRGQELVPHRDRPECEHSVTLHLASSSTTTWPIHLRQRNTPPVQVDLGRGDGLLYRGDAVLHWRDPLEADWYLQLFLHYVDAEGPYADRRFDGRGSLGTARGGRS